MTSAILESIFPASGFHDTEVADFCSPVVCLLGGTITRDIPIRDIIEMSWGI